QLQPGARRLQIEIGGNGASHALPLEPGEPFAQALTNAAAEREEREPRQRTARVRPPIRPKHIRIVVPAGIAVHGVRTRDDRRPERNLLAGDLLVDFGTARYEPRGGIETERLVERSPCQRQLVRTGVAALPFACERVAQLGTTRKLVAEAAQHARAR